MRPFPLLVAAGLLALAGCAELDAPSSSRGDAALLVRAHAVVSQSGWGTEPSVLVGQDGAIYVTAAGGAGTAGTRARERSRLWVSHDEGATFGEVPFAEPGRGASNLPAGLEGALAMDAAGAVYFTDLAVGNAAVARTTDGGRTWELRTPAAFAAPSGDREWIAGGAKDVVAVSWDNLPFATDVGPASRTHVVAVSRDGGRTFPGQTRFTPDAALAPGPPAFGPEGNLYVPRAVRDGVVVWRSVDQGATFEPFLARRTAASTSFIFVVPAVAPDGTLYVAWAEDVDGTSEVHYAASRDAAETWTPPVRVSAPGLASALPWIAAADGRVALAYYGNDEPGLPDATTGRWFPHLVVVDDAASAAPRLRALRLTDEPVVTGPLCTGGTACTYEGRQGSRDLADYLGVAFAPDGSAHVAWTSGERRIHWARVA